MALEWALGRCGILCLPAVATETDSELLARNFGFLEGTSEEDPKRGNKGGRILPRRFRRKFTDVGRSPEKSGRSSFITAKFKGAKRSVTNRFAALANCRSSRRRRQAAAQGKTVAQSAAVAILRCNPVPQYFAARSGDSARLR